MACATFMRTWTKRSDDGCASSCSSGGESKANRKDVSTIDGQTPTLTSWASGGWRECTNETTNQRNCSLESRMRENRPYGSEGGVALTPPLLPLSLCAAAIGKP